MGDAIGLCDDCRGLKTLLFPTLVAVTPLAFPLTTSPGVSKLDKSLRLAIIRYLEVLNTKDRVRVSRYEPKISPAFSFCLVIFIFADAAAKQVLVLEEATDEIIQFFSCLVRFYLQRLIGSRQGIVRPVASHGATINAILPTSYLVFSRIVHKWTGGQKFALFLLCRGFDYRICPGIRRSIILAVLYALSCAGKALQGYPFVSTCADDT